MTEPLGSVCLVLHGHLPYVLHHGAQPHGEAWLYEAAAETYLPLLDVIGELVLHKARPALTIGLTPILLEQLADDYFKSGFVDYLNERRQRAADDRRAFVQGGNVDLAPLAERWEQWYATQLETFEKIRRDIPAQFAAHARAGHIQILTSNATHAYMPLLLNDQSIAAQMSCGVATSEKQLGQKSQGMWLPECAYRPATDQWTVPPFINDPRPRPGLEKFIAAAGVNHFFVDAHMLKNGLPLGLIESGKFRPLGETQLYWDHRRGWKNPLEPVGVVSKPHAPDCYAFARHPQISEQVWSGWIGYPGGREYLEFHKKHGPAGLRYWKITDNKSDLGAKLPYKPDDIAGKIYEHAHHYCNLVRETLREYRQATGRPGTVVAPFDAELFGHWWFEGPRFLRDVLFNFNNMPEVNLTTAQAALEAKPPDKVMRLPEGSWGEGGDHQVWMNDKVKWMWEVEYRAENQMLAQLKKLPWQTKPQVKAMLERAGRQLFLLQSSDWPFVIHSGGAVDYGIQRFSGHATQFNRAIDIADTVAAGRKLSSVQQIEIQDMDAHDTAFSEIDLNWWS